MPVLVFVRGKFDSIEFYDGMLGPLFLLIPFLTIKSKENSEIKSLGIFSLIFIFYWAFTTKQVRFLIPIMPVISLLLAWGLAQQKRPVFTGFAFILMILNVFAGVHEVWKKNPFSYWQGKESRDLYLARQLGNYPFYSLVNKTLGSKDKIYQINMKNYGYFLDHDYESDFIFERWRLDALLAHQPSESQIAEFFKHRQVTHFMIDEAYVTSMQWGMEPDKLARFKSFLQGHAESVFREGAYALYRLK